MEAKTILITGATDGIGRATAHKLAERGARVVVHGRSSDKVAQVVDEIRTTYPNAPAPHPQVAELSSLQSVRDLADAVGREFPALDVLLNNAGVFMNERQLTVDGFEMTWAVNHLAHFLLTNLLRPNLAAAEGARVVTVSSIAHNRGRIHWDDLQLKSHWDIGRTPVPRAGYVAYAQSKLANVLFANALARRVESDGVASNSLHPGVIGTKLLMKGFGMDGASTDDGAATSVYVALADELTGVTGRYFSASRETPAADHALDVDAQERLWALSEEMVGL